MPAGRPPGSTPEEEFPAHQRRRRLEEMLVTGVTSYCQMAAAFGVTETQIRNDVKIIRKKWLQESPKRAQERVITRVRQVESIYLLSVNEFKRSQQDRVEVTMHPCDYPGCLHGIVRSDDGNEQCERCRGDGYLSTRKFTKQTGLPAYLNIAKECIIECARLEGNYSTAMTGLRKMARDTLPDGTIRERIEEMYQDAPFEMIIDGLTQIDAVKEKLRNRPKKTIDVKALGSTSADA